MNIYEEYNALNFAKEFIKADEIACKMQGTNTFQRDCLRKALEQLLGNRKTELEEIYQNLLKQNEKKEK